MIMLSAIESYPNGPPEERMSGSPHNGLMMDDYALSLTAIVERAEQLSGDREVVSRRPDGSIHRTTLGACAGRARRLAGALRALGIGDTMLLERRASELAAACAVPLEALDLGLHNWGVGRRVGAGVDAQPDLEAGEDVLASARAALGCS